MAKTKTVTKRKTQLIICHSCLGDFKSKDLYRISMVNHSVFMCEKCCKDKGVSGERYSEILKERRKYISSVMGYKTIDKKDTPKKKISKKK